jgi:hypothetical protein
MVIAGDEALAAFRDGLTGDYAYSLLREACGRLLIQLPVGVGKTEWLIEIIAHVMATQDYDLILVLLPRRDILEEVRQRLPKGISPRILRPRPRRRCGDLDEAWLEHEQAGCGALGRESICSSCPRRNGCHWPGQYSRLRGVQLILATQQHLVIDPYFVDRLSHQARAQRVLTLLDESDLLLRSGERTITRQALERFIAAQETILAKIEPPPLATTGAATAIPQRSQRLKLTQVDRIAAPHGGRKEQNRFLEIRSQEDQVENLADAGAGHMSELANWA